MTKLSSSFHKQHKFKGQGHFGHVVRAEEQKELPKCCQISRKEILPGGESNPGLPRDRRGYLPLYYRGLHVESLVQFRGVQAQAPKSVKCKRQGSVPGRKPSKWKRGTKKVKCPSSSWNEKKISFEPDLNQRPMDFCFAVPTTVHRSTNWAIEGWLRWRGLKCQYIGLWAQPI